MLVESWLNPEDVPDFAAHATAMIDAALTGSGLTREVYWAAVRKGYNTPYNDPPRKDAVSTRVAPARPDALPETEIGAVEPMTVPAAVIAALAAEVRAV